MSGLTKTQHDALVRIDKSSEITEADKVLLPGIHWCHDWDMLPVCDGLPEAECCTCTTNPESEHIGTVSLDRPGGGG